MTGEFEFIRELSAPVGASPPPPSARSEPTHATEIPVVAVAAVPVPVRTVTVAALNSPDLVIEITVTACIPS